MVGLRSRLGQWRSGPFAEEIRSVEEGTGRENRKCDDSRKGQSSRLMRVNYRTR